MSRTLARLADGFRLRALSFVLHALIKCLPYFSPFSQKLAESVSGRKGLVERIQAFRASHRGQPIWIHFASSGEFEQAVPVIETLKTHYPQVPIALTYFSPSGKRAVDLERRRRESEGVGIPWDFSDYSPWDTLFSVNNFLDALSPRCWIGVHRELWPVLLTVLESRDIPRVLIACHFSISEKSRSLAMVLLGRSKLSAIAVSDVSSKVVAERNRLSIQTPEVFGDTRIDRILDRKRRPWKDVGLFSRATHPIVLGASLWPEDFRAMRGWIQRNWSTRSFDLVLVPHEPTPDFLNEMERTLKVFGIPFRRWTEWRQDPASHVVLIVDTVGDLVDLYRIADVAFVGGSFRRRVHSVLEPAVMGVAVVTGPHVGTAAEMAALTEAGGAIKTRSPQELARTLDLLLVADERAKVIQRAKFMADRGEDASRRLVARLREWANLGEPARSVRADERNRPDREGASDIHPV